MLYWVLIANVSLNGFEDGRFVGDATVPLTKARSCADAERAGALYEFMLKWITCCPQRNRRFSSLVCGSDHLAVVGTYQTVRNGGVFGTGKKKRIPCALRWTANDPVAWEKAVGGSGEFGADWRDPLAFLSFLARTADAHKTRQKCEKDQVICDLTTLLWRRRRAFARQRQVVFLREACEAKRSPVQRKRGNHFNWLRVFGQEPPSSELSTQTFLRSLFRLNASCS